MIAKIRPLVIFAVLVAGPLTACRGADPAAASAAAGWPAWRGPNRDGKSADKGLVKTWPEGGPKRLWSLSGIGTGFSSVSIGGGLIYISGHKGRQLYVTAIDMDGKVKWSKGVTPGTRKDPAGSRATATYDGGNLYLEAGTGVVGCYDAKSGQEKWTRKLSEFGGRAPGWAFAESVLIVGDLAVVSPGGTSFMVALNKATGATVWESEGWGSAHYSSPIHVVYQNVPMIINGARDGLVGVHAKTGKILWSKKFASGNTANCPTPAFSDGYVFWSVGYGKGAICVKLSVSAAAVTATEAWRTKDMVCHHGGFVILDGYIYGNHSKGWTCLELKTGRKQWYESGVGKGSLCYADGMLYVFGEEGGLAGLAELSPTGFKLAGTFSVAGKGPSWAHPVVTGGRLYLRYDDNLYCFDVKDPTKVVATATDPAPDKPAPTVDPAAEPAPEPAGDDGQKKAAGKLRLAKVYLTNRKNDKAVEILKAIVADFPDTSAAKTAAKMLQELTNSKP